MIPQAVASRYNDGMSSSSQTRSQPSADQRRFLTTRWSVVVAAGDRGASDSLAALEALCRAYWYPLYVFARRHGASEADAQDRTQSFFAELLEQGWLESADRARGRFRTFLLTAFQRFLVKEREKERAQKRGGGRAPLSIDLSEGERRYSLEPSHDWTAERLFHRRWALTVLDQVLARLEAEYTAQGKGRLFERLKVHLTGAEAAPSHAETAAELQMTEGAIKVAAHRLRRRYRNALRQTIADTLADSHEIEDELGHLLAALRGE
ncbi:MAG: RNA polymerase sigma factor [Planctomycetaceae bacterium]